MHNLTFIKPLVAAILRDKNREWTIQGFGFLRTYFGPPENLKKYRLNLWDSYFTVPNVSTIHDHPWDFKSLIVAGQFCNQRYNWSSSSSKPTHSYNIIKTGEGGGLSKSPIQSCELYSKNKELYMPGDTYSQTANEIHETLFKDGSITLNERIGDTEQARVFWPYGTDWVDAIPRKATPNEVKISVEKSLDTWFLV